MFFFNFKTKVISYFDPYKYHEHWEKTKKTNSELHNNVIDNTPVNTMRVSLFLFSKLVFD
jgi:hypothetical protein